MDVHFIMGRGFDANIFLILAEAPILVDAGTGRYTSEVVSQIRRRINPKQVDSILLTHRHIDHVGGAEELSRICDAQLYASLDDAPPLINGDRKTTGSDMFSIPFNRIDVDILKYGERFDLGDEKVRILHTPGHTIGSIALYHEDSGSLFSGDTVFADGGVGRWDFETGNYKQLLESVGILAKMKPRNLYPGHGPCVHGEATNHIETSLKFLRYAELL